MVRETEPGLQHMNASKAPQAVQQLDGAYRIRRAESARDARKLHDLFAEVFHPEEVGVLAETMFHHLPRMEYRYWFIAEEVKTERIVSAFALIPWTWEMEGVRLKVAEMGIVGTLKAHRWQGLMRALNTEFDATLSTPMRRFDPSLSELRLGVYLGQEVNDAWSEAQVPCGTNN